MSASPLLDATSSRTKVVAVVLVLALLYSVFVLGNVAAFVSFALSAAFLWLLYRFVLAHERIASAQERRTRAAERRADSAEAATGDGTTEADGDEPPG